MAQKVANRKLRLSSRLSKRALTPEEIYEKTEKKAYELFEKRGSAHGNDWADWFEAEKSVKSGN